MSLCILSDQFSQDYLINCFKNTLVVVSHDRTFLNEVVTDIVEFTNKKRLVCVFYLIELQSVSTLNPPYSPLKVCA